MTWDKFVEWRTQEMKSTDWGRYTKVGVECPQCKNWLFRDNTAILTSNPPQHRYVCKNCDWVGTTY